MPTVHARWALTGSPVSVTLEAGRITAVGPGPATALSWLAPSFCDVQINGCLGIAFNAPTLTTDEVRTVTTECRRHGIGRYCPTLITGSFEAIAHGFRTLAKLIDTDADLARAIVGFHLEGPYLSGEDGPRGAHPREHIRDPDWDEFQRWQEAAGGRIRMVTLAPERAGAIPFIERLVKAGVVVAIGHTGASREVIRAAIDAGARTATHLGNGCHAVLPRHDNYLWEQLADDRLWASIIPDGHHLPAPVVKSMVRVKTPARMLMTCDAGSLAGLPPGRYTAWGTELEVLPGGKLVVPGTPFLAGSGHFTDHCVDQLIRLGEVTLADAITMATIRPRELLDLPVPRLAVGEPADFVLFDWSPTYPLTVRGLLESM